MGTDREVIEKRIGWYISIMRDPGYYNCRCDPDVGHVCDGCDIVDVLCESRREIERLQLYERAMKSMAAQLVCPKKTAEELAKMQLGEE